MNTRLLLTGFYALPILLCSAYVAAVADQGEIGPVTPKPAADALSECYSIGLEIAIRESGMLYKAEADVGENEEVCNIVVIIPGADNERPRRAEFEVPRSR